MTGNGEEDGGMMMELKDFVGQVLGQISSGVEKAQAELGLGGARINPGIEILYEGAAQGSKLLGWAVGPSRLPVLLVDFEVAVTTSDREGSKGGVGIFLASMAAGSQASSDSGKSSTATIRFSVPITLRANPSDKDLKPMPILG